jgi:hypothetical protein
MLRKRHHQIVTHIVTSSITMGIKISFRKRWCEETTNVLTNSAFTSSIALPRFRHSTVPTNRFATKTTPMFSTPDKWFVAPYSNQGCPRGRSGPLLLQVFQRHWLTWNKVLISDVQGGGVSRVPWAVCCSLLVHTSFGLELPHRARACRFFWVVTQNSFVSGHEGFAETYSIF